MSSPTTNPSRVLGRRQSRRAQERKIKNDLLRAARENKQQLRELKQWLRTQKKKCVWNGLDFVPSGTLVEAFVAAFQEKTDIPLEIPFFTVLMAVAAHLLQAGVRIDLDGQVIRPTLWTVVLAPSGAGKSFTYSTFLRLTGARLDLMPDAASAAKWVENLSEHNNGLWIRDEFGQLFKAIATQKHLAELKDYILRTYDGSRLDRNTKEQELAVENPALNILGMSVDSTWTSCVSAESMLDGLAQRFNYVIAQERADVVPLYNLSSWETEVRVKWGSLASIPLAPVYRVTDAARRAFGDLFMASYHEQATFLPKSYHRRISFSTLRYALVYHLLLGKASAEIDAEDMGWAWRLASRHATDTATLINGYGLSEIAQKLSKVEGLLAETRSKGATLKARDIVRGICSIGSAAEARALLELALEGDDAATSAELAEASREDRERRPFRIVPGGRGDGVATAS